MGGPSVISHVKEYYIESAPSPMQFVERIKTAKPSTGLRPFVHSYIRTFVHSYIKKHPDVYPTAAAKIQFCDWLKQFGITDSGIDDYKKDLESGTDAPTDSRAKGKGTGGAGGATK